MSCVGVVKLVVSWCHGNSLCHLTEASVLSSSVLRNQQSKSTELTQRTKANESSIKAMGPNTYVTIASRLIWMSINNPMIRSTYRQRMVVCFTCFFGWGKHAVGCVFPLDRGGSGLLFSSCERIVFCSFVMLLWITQSHWVTF